MEVANYFFVRAIFKISIKKRYSNEKCLVVTFKVGQDLYHPVDHSSSQGIVDIMPLQAISTIKVLLEISQIFVDILAKFGPNINILPINICGKLS